MFQKTVNTDMGLGVPGNIYLKSPTRAESLIVHSGGKANTYGLAYTKDAATNIAQVGGTISAGRVFAGLMVNSKEAALHGGLSPSLTVPDGSRASFAVMGDVVVHVSTACKIGDFVVYDADTGELSTVEDKGSLNGKQIVPNAVVYAQPVSNQSGGLVVVRLTN